MCLSMPVPCWWLHDECLFNGQTWGTYDMNFDNFGIAMVTLFEISTFEGWPWHMYFFINGTKVGPMKHSDQYFGLFYMSFIMVGSVISVNLFVAIICINYSIAEEKSKNKHLTEDQQNWIEIQRLIISAQPDLSGQYTPKNKF